MSSSQVEMEVFYILKNAFNVLLHVQIKIRFCEAPKKFANNLE